MSPRNAESAQPELPPSDADRISMPKFRRDPEPSHPELRRGPVGVPADGDGAQPAARKPGVNREPLTWPLPPVQELNKLRMLLQEERAKHGGDEPEPGHATTTDRELVRSSATGLSATSPAPTQLPTQPLEAAPLESGNRNATATTAAAEITHPSLEVATFVQQLWKRRVRIRLAASVRLGRIVSRPVQGWRVAMNAVRRNARLATSMAMAAFSALLALGLMLTVRHYNPATKIAVHSAARPAEAAKSTTALSKKTVAAAEIGSLAAKPDSSKPRPQAGASPAPVMQAADRKAIHRQPHRNKGDDYVARDTYVYYGKR